MSMFDFLQILQALTKAKKHTVSTVTLLHKEAEKVDVSSKCHSDIYLFEVGIILLLIFALNC